MKKMNWRLFIMLVSGQLAFWCGTVAIIQFVVAGDAGWEQYVFFFASTVLLAALLSSEKE